MKFCFFYSSQEPNRLFFKSKICHFHHLKLISNARFVLRDSNCLFSERCPGAFDELENSKSEKKKASKLFFIFLNFS